MHQKSSGETASPKSCQRVRWRGGACKQQWDSFFWMAQATYTKLALCLLLPQSTGITHSAPQELGGCGVSTTLNKVYTRDKEKTTASGSIRKLGWRAPSPSGHMDVTMKFFITLGIFWIWFSSRVRRRFGIFSSEKKCLSPVAMHKLLYGYKTLKGASQIHMIFFICFSDLQ